MDFEASFHGVSWHLTVSAERSRRPSVIRKGVWSERCSVLVERRSDGWVGSRITFVTKKRRNLMDCTIWNVEYNLAKRTVTHESQILSQYPFLKVSIALFFFVILINSLTNFINFVSVLPILLLIYHIFLHISPSFFFFFSIDLSSRFDSLDFNGTSSSSTGAIAGRFARLLAAPVIALAHYRTRKPHKHFYDDQEVDLKQFKRFSVRELQVASDNFSNKNILGRGGFGKVYKGRLADGSLVAVTRLKEERTQGLKRYFQTTIEIASMTEHANLLWLLGICMTPTEMMLVYPYMSNGSVASCLRERPESQPPLDWPKRKQIALGSARGLAYLHHHCDRKIIHRDVKAANIFLDEHFEAFIGDFELAKLMDHEDTHVDAAVSGTIGHIAPEYLSTGKCSEKTDVFGYGVMLLELITAQRAFDLARLANDDDVMLLDWVKGLLTEKKWGTFVDPDLRGNYIDEVVEQLVQLALLCTQGSPTDRPKMSEVVMMLEGDELAERWDEWQKARNDQPNTDWIITDDITQPIELSGPR
ncbi:hypothetical protein ACJIZ3_023271 [Penstemon smallii]|uniref:non-specific serine/threonine protein kinase n=1 Tax=Penstemon smallii TaxID=265156 RepID=A0ABD3TPN3_9LAMI